MTEGDRPLYCTQCGSIVQPGDNFCENCGARVSPNAPEAVPVEEVPTQVDAPPDAPAAGRKLKIAMIAGAGVVLVLILGRRAGWRRG